MTDQGAPATAQARAEARLETLKQIGSMNASVGTKANEQLLLKLNKRVPEVFTDICLYRSVCSTGLPVYRFTGRHFVEFAK